MEKMSELKKKKHTFPVLAHTFSREDLRGTELSLLLDLIKLAAKDGATHCEFSAEIDEYHMEDLTIDFVYYEMETDKEFELRKEAMNKEYGERMAAKEREDRRLYEQLKKRFEQ